MPLELELQGRFWDSEECHYSAGSGSEVAGRRGMLFVIDTEMFAFVTWAVGVRLSCAFSVPRMHVARARAFCSQAFALILAT